MSSLDDLKELDNFDTYRAFIKDFFINTDDLFKLVYYPLSSPLDTDLPDNPYTLFQEQKEDNPHGVVLFKQKNDEVLSFETPVILVNFSSETSQDSDCVNIVTIEYSIILKGTNIQTLSDDSNRANKIAELIDEQFNHAKINNTGEIKRVSFEKLSINEQNCGYTLIYKSVSASYSDEIQVYTHQQSEDEWGITRENYSLLTTNTPILVDIHLPQTDSKVAQQYGYNIDTIRTMICDITPNITESSIIKYNNNFYRIKKIVEYEDYWNCTLEVTYNAIINE